MERSEYHNNLVKSSIIMLDLITGPSVDNDDRGEYLDQARFYIYEDIIKGRINCDNITTYRDLYKRITDTDTPTQDDGQLCFDTIS